MAGGNYDPRKVRGYKAGGSIRDRGIARDGQGAPSRLGGNTGNTGNAAPSGSPADNPNQGQVAKGGMGKSGMGHVYDGTTALGMLAARPQLDISEGDIVGALGKAIIGGVLGGLPGAAMSGLSSLFGLGDLSDFDFSSGKPGVVSGKGPGGSGTGGGPGTPEILRNRPTLQNPTGSALSSSASDLEALRTSADIQNYLTDLERIALGKEDSQAALERFGVSPEQAMFDYRNSFPEFGDSLANLSLGEITKALGNMSRAPEKFAEGGRAGDTFGSRPNQEDTTVSTDLARFTQMLSDLMMLPSGTDDGRGIENPFGGPDKPQARRPVQEATPGGLMPQTGSPFYGGDAEAFRFVMEKPAEMPDPLGREFNARQRYPRPSEIEVEPLALFNPDPQAPPVATAEVRTGNDRAIELEQIGSGANIYPEAAKAMAQEAVERNQSYDILMPDVPTVSEMGINEDIAEEIRRFEEMGSSQDRFYIDQYRVGSQDAERIAYYILRSRGLSPQEAKKRIDTMTADELSQMRPGGFAGGGQVRGRRNALPMIEGDHVVPAHAVKGNEGGLAALSKKLMGNKNYDGMIRGPGGPREDAIKTRVFAAGGGIAGKMDNLQNPFNSVPARVSDKEYVIPRQAITNLGMMNGAREGDANKAGQDIIYQLVENLKRKA